MLVALKYFSVCIPVRLLEGAMYFVTLSKQKSAIKSPHKKSASPSGSPNFVAASLKSGKVEQNFVKTKHAGRARHTR